MTTEGGEHLGVSMLNVYNASLIQRTHCAQSNGLSSPSALHGWNLSQSVTSKCLPASCATSACGSQLIMELEGWLSAPKLSLCLEVESWSRGEYWSAVDGRQLPHLLSINWDYFASTCLSSHVFSTSHLFQDLTAYPQFLIPSCPLPSSLTLPFPAIYLYGHAFGCLCTNPFSDPILPMVNVKIRLRDSPSGRMCVILI